METWIWLVCYFIAANLVGFAAMGIDKAKARKRAWRIPEATFFLVAVLGGGLGCFIGMYCFHHKTRHWYFVWGMPIIFIIEAAVFLYLLFSPSINIMIM